ncbi:MAG: ribosomal RNA small subunit methyltransferase A [Candidatus Omnitrophica bacterium]|nr:ribosomal RNA small subunit methyltransferase A [Candidatus Omnitrophota bacterium]MDE2008819.1 ribosomal RNA small subunit methyltransferase A [Candidatus Omnitrophota bacterium]MDE2213618.1 ribosomal RNA small subunit methyltransferase A [Candidatus Omnitrophota bacterium]MDE2230481.1 ribosomal RNA small subunit methyltransferase A [Candidatus Omnitrophota bacterium]
MKPPHRPKKYLGQNFLVDGRIQQKIIQACDFKHDDVVVEIGPGQGALTRLIGPQVKKLICVEADRDLIGALRSGFPAPVEIVHADFLKMDMGHLPDGIKVIGNIPYYISTPIIEKLIENRKKISEAFLTVQLEFGRRLVAAAGGKDYGSLSCFVQYYTGPKMLFKIKNTCFRPVPKVDSGFVRLIMRGPDEETGDIEQFLFKVIQTAFQQRRKTIVNALKSMLGKEKLERALADLGIKADARPEGLTLSNYIGLSRRLML